MRLSIHHPPVFREKKHDISKGLLYRNLHTTCLSVYVHPILPPLQIHRHLGTKKERRRRLTDPVGSVLSTIVTRNRKGRHFNPITRSIRES